MSVQSDDGYQTVCTGRRIGHRDSWKRCIAGKSLQRLIEQNIETMLGIRLLGSEYSTGPKHGGRIDTLGIDENASP